MAGNFVSNNCRAVPYRLTTTGLTIVLTATGYTQLIGLRIVNFHASSTPVVNVQYKPLGTGTAYYIQANYTMPVATTLWLPFDAFALKDTDEILVQASIANTVDVLSMIAEVPGRSA